MATYKFYAGFKPGMTTGEILSIETDEYTLSIPVYPDGDANNDAIKEISVTVISPIGYVLTDRDYADIDILLADER